MCMINSISADVARFGSAVFIDHMPEGRLDLLLASSEPALLEYSLIH